MNNCWEYLNCPEERQKNCPAYTTQQGTNCWKVPQTLCRGEVQGTVAQKIPFCRECKFFNNSISMNKYPIKRKLMTGFGILIGLLLFIGIFSYYEMNQIRDNYDNLVDQRLAVINQTNNSLILIEKSALNLRNYLITGDNSYLDKHTAEIDEANDVMDKIRTILQTEQGKKIYDEFAQSYASYKYYANNMINLRRLANFDPSVNAEQQEIMILKQIQQQTLADKGTVNGTIDTGRKLIEYVNELVKSEQVTIQRQVNQLITIISVIILIGLAAGLAVAIYVSNLIAKPISKLEQAVAKIAAGDLTSEEVVIHNRDEVGTLAMAFNQMTISLKDLVLHIKEKAESVSAASEELTSTSQQSSTAATEASSTLMELAATVERVSENTNQVSASSQSASHAAEAGRQGLEQVEGQMATIKDSTERVSQVINELNQASGQISQIVEMITQIAEQTNLLALNAAIEAARAGEQGRGFAVVAEEVRKLAEQSGTAAKRIKDLIFTIQEETARAVTTMSEGVQEVDKGTQVVQEVAISFQQILAAIQEVTTQIQDVAASSQQISAGVQTVAGTAQEQAAMMEELSASSEALAQMAEELNNTSARFKI
ncbi:methyl-accepting chemotaxis protein [Desulforamulus ferrireducens]|uniref:Chemotaxis protein n=1 Tax=Desulforamulus ferrireducens TaxID=1833852 RepID=A0A1S6IWB8_9FIRM|nr:methyl-accepting chemotaxis protein [Desulforamulus ferrireducens]AQS59040.1 chemotaxis protein [Desulforamulus ferrireducens]